MEKMWAPWRTKYVTQEREKGCFLCRVLSESNDAGNFVVHRGQAHFVLLNLYPYNNGHLMIAPNRHIKDMEQLSEDEQSELMTLTVRSIQVLKRGLNAQGFNAGINLGIAAGAGLEDHLHFHIVPRWQGDTNFMPTLADVKIISQHMEETFGILKKAWDGGR